MVAEVYKYVRRTFSLSLFSPSILFNECVNNYVECDGRLAAAERNPKGAAHLFNILLDRRERVGFYFVQVSIIQEIDPTHAKMLCTLSTMLAKTEGEGWLSFITLLQ